MRICIVIASESFRQSAGMRIRYDRFRDHLTGSAHSITSVTVEELVKAKTYDSDAYVFCKTFDVQALLLARRLKALGKVIAQDLFDDYFSQFDDPRLRKFRSWLRCMAPVTDVAICSTRQLAEVVRPYFPSTPVIVIDDPVANFQGASIVADADRKLAEAAATRTLKLCWFGIGDNPYFRVGVADLRFFEPDLALLARRGWRVELSIVTNRRPFEENDANALLGYSFPWRFVEWSEEIERAVLENSVAAIVPVSGQNFSRAKTLNRAVTALTAGCQVISLGYPLYKQLGDFVYRSTDAFEGDVRTGKGLLCSERVEALEAQVAKVADPFALADAFVSAIEAAVTSNASTQRRTTTALLHGHASKFADHKLAAMIGGLSISAPFCQQKWNFHVRFEATDGLLSMWALTGVAKRFGGRFSEREDASRVWNDNQFYAVDLVQLGISPLPMHLDRSHAPAEWLGAYNAVIDHVQLCCTAAFGTVDLLVADVSEFVPRVPVLAS